MESRWRETGLAPILVKLYCSQISAHAMMASNGTGLMGLFTAEQKACLSGYVLRSSLWCRRLGDPTFRQVDTFGHLSRPTRNVNEESGDYRICSSAKSP